MPEKLVIISLWKRDNMLGFRQYKNAFFIENAFLIYKLFIEAQ